MLIGTWMRNDSEEGMESTRLSSPRAQEPTPAQILATVKKTPGYKLREEPERQARRRSRPTQTLAPPRVELDFSHILGEKLATNGEQPPSQTDHDNALFTANVKRPAPRHRLKEAGMLPNRDIQIRKEGQRHLVDARIPLSQLRPGAPGKHLIHVQGELRIEGHGTQKRVYFEPSSIDGMPPPAFIREKIRRTDISHLIGNTDTSRNLFVP